MATTPERRHGVKRQRADGGAEAGEVVRDQFEEFGRQGARQMLMAALQDERDAYPAVLTYGNLYVNLRR